MWRKWHLSYFVLAAALLPACNNYDLKEKLENPGGATAEKFTDRLFAFVTTAVTKGDMQGLVAGNCGGTGIVRADCVCQQLAQTNGRRMNSNSRFVAWLSQAAPDPRDMRCRIQGLSGAACALPSVNLTWYNTNFQPVFSGILGAPTTGAELFTTFGATTLPASLKFTESGSLLTGGQLAWTGTNTTGNSPGTNDCNNWADATNTPFGQNGISDALNNSWTQNNTATCGTDLHLYCFALP
jgi:hypothetical protein